MEPVALRIQPPVQLDPIGAATKGVQLGQLGLQTEKLRQDLITQQLQQDTQRQQLRTAAIGEEEARRALQMRQYEDTARRSLAEIKKRHTKPDASGRLITDHRAALAEARMAGLDPTFTTELEGKVIANEASGLKNETERVDYIKKYLDELARQLIYMEEDQAARFLEQRAPLLARATNMQSQDIGRIVAEHFNLGRPGASIVKTARMYVDAQISQERERQLAGQGLGREDFNPSSTTSRQAREFLVSRGLNPPANANFVELRKDPRFEVAIKEYEAQRLGQVPTAGMRREDVIKASEIRAARMTYNDAFAFESELKQLFGTRPGSITQEALNNWINQSPERALFQAAIDQYEKETGAKLDVAKEGFAAVFARLRGQERKLLSEQRTFGTLGATTSIAAEAQGKIPPTPGEAPRAPAAPAPAAPRERVSPETQRQRDTEAVRVLQSEYSKEVAKLEANPNDEAAKANVDALARELKRQHKVTVPGASDVLRGARAEAPKPAARETIRVRNKANGKVYDLPRDLAEKEIAGGRFVRM